MCKTLLSALLLSPLHALASSTLVARLNLLAHAMLAASRFLLRIGLPILCDSSALHRKRCWKIDGHVTGYLQQKYNFENGP